MTTSIETLGDRGSAAGLMGRLSDQVRAVRTRASGFGYDRLMLVAGGVLMPVGVILILLGWAGAARTPFAWEQTDYLISGGILGLALVFAGGFLYFSYWNTVRINESRDQARHMVAALGRVEALLSGGAGVDDTGRAIPAPRRFVATPNGSIFHRPDCAAVAGRSDVKDIDVERTSLKPCRICSPLE